MSRGSTPRHDPTAGHLGFAVQFNAEVLYQRLLAFIDDNLVCKDSNITNHGDKPDDDEELSQALENVVILV